jgi:L,D-transpeptidase catalytic domain
MPRRHLVLVRVLAGTVALTCVAQCGGSSDSTVGTVSTSAREVIVAGDTTPTTEASIVDNTVVDTSAPATTTTTTTIPVTTTTMVPDLTTTTTLAPVLDPNCPITPHGAVIDRDRQRAYLCDNGVALPEFVITTAINQPDPGTYPVYGKTMHTSSRIGGHYSTMTNFVAFTRGKETGARVAFHTVPVLRNGEYAQPLDSVGTEEHHGDSAGCIRVLPEEGQVVWDWLQIGDDVHVIT